MDFGTLNMKDDEEMVDILKTGYETMSHLELFFGTTKLALIESISEIPSDDKFYPQIAMMNNGLLGFLQTGEKMLCRVREFAGFCETKGGFIAIDVIMLMEGISPIVTTMEKFHEIVDAFYESVNGMGEMHQTLDGFMSDYDENIQRSLDKIIELFRAVNEDFSDEDEEDFRTRHFQPPVTVVVTTDDENETEVQDEPSPKAIGV